MAGGRTLGKFRRSGGYVRGRRWAARFCARVGAGAGGALGTRTYARATRTRQTASASTLPATTPARAKHARQRPRLPRAAPVKRLRSGCGRCAEPRAEHGQQYEDLARGRRCRRGKEPAPQHTACAEHVHGGQDAQQHEVARERRGPEPGAVSVASCANTRIHRRAHEHKHEAHAEPLERHAKERHGHGLSQHTHRKCVPRAAASASAGAAQAVRASRAFRSPPRAAPTRRGACRTKTAQSRGPEGPWRPPTRGAHRLHRRRARRDAVCARSARRNSPRPRQTPTRAVRQAASAATKVAVAQAVGAGAEAHGALATAPRRARSTWSSRPGLPQGLYKHLPRFRPTAHHERLGGDGAE